MPLTSARQHPEKKGGKKQSFSSLRKKTLNCFIFAKRLLSLSPPVLRKRATRSERSARGGRLSGKRARVISGDNIGCKTRGVARSFTWRTCDHKGPKFGGCHRNFLLSIHGSADATSISIPRPAAAAEGRDPRSTAAEGTYLTRGQCTPCTGGRWRICNAPAPLRARDLGFWLLAKPHGVWRRSFHHLRFWSGRALATGTA